MRSASNHVALARGQAALRGAIATMRGQDDVGSAQHLITGLRALRRARQLGAGGEPDVAWVQHYSALAAYRVGRLAMARRLAGQALGGFEAAGDRYGQACAHNFVGVMALEMQALSDAYAAFGRAQGLDDGAHPTLRGKILTNLSLTALTLGDHETALRWSQASLDHCRASGDQEGVARGLLNSVELCVQLGRLPLAQDYALRALALATTLGAQGVVRSALLSRAELLGRAGDHAQAVTLSLQSLALAREHANPSDEAKALGQLGESLLALGDSGAALTHFHAALTLLGGGEDARSVDLLRGVGRAHAARGQWAQGREALERAITLGHARRDWAAEAEALKAAAALEAAAGCHAQALDYFQRYHDLDRTVYSEQRTRLTEALIITHEVDTHRQLSAQLQAANARLQHAADHDPLLDVLNRRALLRLADSAAKQGALLIDLDHFKAVNDTHGHAVGDRALQAAVAVIRAELRGKDLLARWGGEEFLALLPGCDLQGAAAAAERIRAAAERHDWNRVHPGLQVTLSVGVAATAGGPSLDSLIKRADHALYAAKNSGRNAVALG